MFGTKKTQISTRKKPPPIKIRLIDFGKSYEGLHSHIAQGVKKAPLANLIVRIHFMKVMTL